MGHRRYGSASSIYYHYSGNRRKKGRAGAGEGRAGKDFKLISVVHNEYYGRTLLSPIYKNHPPNAQYAHRLHPANYRFAIRMEYPKSEEFLWPGELCYYHLLHSTDAYIGLRY